MWGAPSCWKYIWLPIINGMSSNKPGNSFLRKTSYVFPVKLLSKTKGLINLLPRKPHHTFTENLLWNLVTLISCGLSWDHVCTFCELFIPFRVKDASLVNKMMLKSWECAVIQWHKSIHWAGSPGSRCTLWSWQGCKFSSCRVRRCEKQFYEWTVVDFSEPSQECSLACQSMVPPHFQTAQQHLEDNQSHALSREYEKIHP